MWNKENMKIENRPAHWAYFGLQLTEEQIRGAMANSRSNREASRNLGITLETYRKYAKKYTDEKTGKTLWDIHLNKHGVGIPRKWAAGVWKKNLDEMLVINQPPTDKRIAKLKELLMLDGRLGYQCSACSYSEKRLSDMKAPLLLSFKSGNKGDWRIENLQWHCYNCYFLFVGEIFSQRVMRSIEAQSVCSPEIKEEAQRVYQLDDFYYEHLKKLGLDNKGDILFENNNLSDTNDNLDDGSEFIDRNVIKD